MTPGGCSPAVPVLLAGIAACAYPTGNYPLEALGTPDAVQEHLDLQSKVHLEHQAHAGWDLVLTVSLASCGEHRPLVDLGRLIIRSDEVRWTRCDYPDGTDLESLIHRVEPDESVTLTVTCQEIRRPERLLEVRFPASGVGLRGYVELSYEGIASEDSP